MNLAAATPSVPLTEKSETEVGTRQIRAFAVAGSRSLWWRRLRRKEGPLTAKARTTRLRIDQNTLVERMALDRTSSSAMV